MGKSSSNEKIEIWKMGVATNASQENLNSETGGLETNTDKASDIADEFEYFYDPYLYRSARLPSNRFISPESRSKKNFTVQKDARQNHERVTINLYESKKRE